MAFLQTPRLLYHAARVLCRESNWALASKNNMLTTPVRQISTTPVYHDIVTIQDEDDFKKQVLKNSKPVLVDFYADWCGPCKILGPRIEKIASENEDKMTLAKVNIDDHMEIAMEYGVSSVPTVYAIKDGAVKDKFIGVPDEDILSSFVAKLVH